MDLCVQNLESKQKLESELEEARKILRKTLCDTCKTNLKNKKIKEKKTSSGITVKGKGNAFILSLLAVSVALVGFYGTSTGNQFNEPALIQNEFVTIEQPNFESTQNMR